MPAVAKKTRSKPAASKSTRRRIAPTKISTKPPKPVTASRVLNLRIDTARGTVKHDHRGPVNIQFKAPSRPIKEAPPMNVYVASIGSTSYVVTAKNVAEGRQFLARVRGVNCDDAKFRLVDQTKQQVWGLFPVTTVATEGEAPKELKRVKAEGGDE